MSISNLGITLSRIKSAKPESPIAVFYAGAGNYDSIFGATVTAQERIKTDKNYILTAHSNLDRYTVENKLRRYAYPKQAG